MAKPASDGAARRPGAAQRFLAPGFLLPFLIFWSCLDRTIVLPLVPVIADDFGSTLVAAGMAVTAHALAYSLLQLVWGPLSTRWGRPKVLWVSTAIAAAANLLTALAPSMTTFLVARTASGGAFAAAFAAVLTYFGDTLAPSRRPAAMSNLATASALGLAAGSLLAAWLDLWVVWRWTFGGYGVVTAVLVLALVRLPDAGDHAGERIWAQLASLARNRWALAIYGLVVVEGFLLIGVLSFLPVALQQSGQSVLVSGFVTVVFGIAVVAMSQSMKLFVARVRPQRFLVAGGVVCVLAFAVLLPGVSPVTVMVGAGLMGVAWALAHTTLQTWIADVAMDARALGMTFFSISLMLGGALGAAAGSLAAGRLAFPALFSVSVVVAALFGVLASLGRARYREREDDPVSIR
ncbi:MAG: MFS transporter [Actinomycetota bacterium]|nr:MFS transporter [Actinomycetota bacterium]MDQ2697697.1 MFS transporter [Actinomycetota bacterium]